VCVFMLAVARPGILKIFQKKVVNKSYVVPVIVRKDIKKRRAVEATKIGLERVRSLVCVKAVGAMTTRKVLKRWRSHGGDMSRRMRINQAPAPTKVSERTHAPRRRLPAQQQSMQPGQMVGI
jgi:hypothetical protein